MVPLLPPWWMEMDFIVLGTVGCASVVFLLSAIIICYKAIKRLEFIFIIVFLFSQLFFSHLDKKQFWSMSRCMRQRGVSQRGGGGGVRLLLSTSIALLGHTEVRGQDNRMGCKCHRGWSTTVSHTETHHVLNELTRCKTTSGLTLLFFKIYTSV